MKFGYTIIYVADVEATVAFYEEAFGLKCRFVHESKLYAEMDTGATALAFAGDEMAGMNGLSVRPNRPDSQSSAWEVCFITDDVDAIYQRAIDAQAIAVSAPQQKPWGQTVAYVKDINGCLVELATPINHQS